jgi:hypothetical protein
MFPVTVDQSYLQLHSVSEIKYEKSQNNFCPLFQFSDLTKCDTDEVLQSLIKELSFHYCRPTQEPVSLNQSSNTIFNNSILLSLQRFH